MGYWAANAVSNWAYGSMFSRVMMDIRTEQAKLEGQALALAASLSTGAAEWHNIQIDEFANKVHTAWWDLFWFLMGKYNDGYIVSRNSNGVPAAAAVGYPKWWLKAVGFETGVDAPSASFVALKKRMNDAAA